MARRSCCCASVKCPMNAQRSDQFMVSYSKVECFQGQYHKDFSELKTRREDCVSHLGPEKSSDSGNILRGWQRSDQDSALKLALAVIRFGFPLTFELDFNAVYVLSLSFDCWRSSVLWYQFGQWFQHRIFDQEFTHYDPRALIQTSLPYLAITHLRRPGHWIIPNIGLFHFYCAYFVKDSHPSTTLPQEHHPLGTCFRSPTGHKLYLGVDSWAPAIHWSQIQKADRCHSFDYGCATSVEKLSQTSRDWACFRLWNTRNLDAKRSGPWIVKRSVESLCPPIFIPHLHHYTPTDLRCGKPCWKMAVAQPGSAVTSSYAFYGPRKHSIHLLVFSILAQTPFRSSPQRRRRRCSFRGLFSWPLAWPLPSYLFGPSSVSAGSLHGAARSFSVTWSSKGCWTACRPSSSWTAQMTQAVLHFAGPRATS